MHFVMNFLYYLGIVESAVESTVHGLATFE